MAALAGTRACTVSTECRRVSSSEPLNTHAGLVNVGMCDGAVRSIPDEIDVAVWRAMSTMRGGEVGTQSDL